jgi:hypothetical protein
VYRAFVDGELEIPKHRLALLMIGPAARLKMNAAWREARERRRIRR